MSKSAEEQFLKDVASHNMTIIKDDGVNRHIIESRESCGGSMSTENLLLREDGYPHLNSQSDEPTLIMDEGGNPILEELAGNKMPANYSFECINHFVHCEDPSYEDLQCLALGMASKIRSLTISALPLPELTGEQLRDIFEKWVTNQGVAMNYLGDGIYGNPTVRLWHEGYIAANDLLNLQAPDAEDLRKENEKLNALLLATNSDLMQALEEKEQLLKAIQQWQPIKTVPKDGTEILMHFVGRRPYATGVKWNGRCFVQLSDYAPVEFLTADGWMILPESPALKGGAA